MLRPTPELNEVERRYARHWNAHATYDDALAVLKALWNEACTLRPDFPELDWRRDLEPDLAIARAVNGRPPDVQSLTARVISGAYGGSGSTTDLCT